MQKNITKRFLLNTFWLSVLLHLLIILSFTTIMIMQPEEKQQSPNVYVPSYVYKNKVTPTIQQQRSVRSRQTTTNERSQQTEDEIKPQSQKKNLAEAKKGIHHQKTILAATLDMLNANQMKAISSSFHNTEPIYLVGEQNAVSDPFIILIGKALSANFEYPRTAGELGIKGKVLISLTLHPEGYFSDVQIVKSSNDRDLDAAALYAVNQAPTIRGMDKFISEPKHFVVGFIFR